MGREGLEMTWCGTVWLDMDRLGPLGKSHTSISWCFSSRCPTGSQAGEDLGSLFQLSFHGLPYLITQVPSVFTWATRHSCWNDGTDRGWKWPAQHPTTALCRDVLRDSSAQGTSIMVLKSPPVNDKSCVCKKLRAGAVYQNDYSDKAQLGSSLPVFTLQRLYLWTTDVNLPSSKF